MQFFNGVVDKSTMKHVCGGVLAQFGEVHLMCALEDVKDVTQGVATVAGWSTGLEDFPLPDERFYSLAEKRKDTYYDGFAVHHGRLDLVTRLEKQHVRWSRVGPLLRGSLTDYFTKCHPFNPYYVFLLSGARGGELQFRQIFLQMGTDINCYKNLLIFTP